MVIVVRNFQEEDFPFILRIALDRAIYRISREIVDLTVITKKYLEKLINIDNNQCFIAQNDSREILGYIIMTLEDREMITGTKQAWIHDMEIKDPYWNSEVSEKLLKKAEEIALKNKLRHMGIRISVSNKEAVEFFQDQGYSKERVKIYKKLSFKYEEKQEDYKETLNILENIKNNIFGSLKGV